MKEKTMRHLGVSLAILGLCQLCTTSEAWQIVASAGPLKTTRQSLSERGIRLDHKSLLDALKGSDQEIQALAAEELAEEHAEDAGPYVITAFRGATNSTIRFNLAQALLQLDPINGQALMTEICLRPQENDAIRLRSIKLLRGLGSHECDASVLEIATQAEDPSVKILAIRLMRNSVSETDSDAIVKLEAKLLNDENNAVRSSAAGALGSSANASALAFMRRRLEIEPDPDVRRNLQTAISDWKGTKAPPN
jgi:HEAT repeat protein